MNTRYPIINTGHTVTISGTIPTNLQNCRSIYIRSGATLNIQSPYTGNTSRSYVLDVCGTLNINLSGMTNFSKFDLVVHSGGVVNITAGTLRVYRIVIESGGVINLNGGRLERECLSSTTPRLDIQAGGTLHINSSSAQLQVHSCLGTAYMAPLIGKTAAPPLRTETSNRGRSSRIQASPLGLFAHRRPTCPSLI